MELYKVDIDDTTDLTPVLLPPTYLQKMNLMLKDVLNFFDENEIIYWADGGTLLGAYRDKGQIKYDDDNDFGMDTKNYFKLIKLMPLLKEKGYDVQEQTDDVIKIVDNNNMYSRKMETENNGLLEIARACCIDVFLYVEKKNEYHLSHKANRLKFPNCIYKKEDLYPLEQYKYDDLLIWGAKNPEQFLSDYYGDWTKRSVYMYL